MDGGHGLNGGVASQGVRSVDATVPCSQRTSDFPYCIACIYQL